MSKLTELVDMVESGTNELEKTADELMPRFANAMQKGREHMGRMKSHVERVEKSIETVEQFNQRMSNMAPADDVVDVKKAP